MHFNSVVSCQSRELALSLLEVRAGRAAAGIQDTPIYRVERSSRNALAVIMQKNGRRTA